MKRMQAAMACATAAFFLAACGGADETAEDGGDPAAPNGGGEAQNGGGEEQYAAGQYNLTEDGAADDQYEEATAENLPVPLPPEAEIVAAGRNGDEAFAALVNIPSGEDAYNFYLEALPEEGFEITRDTRADRIEAEENRSGEEGEGGNGEGGNGEGAEGRSVEDEPFSAYIQIRNEEYSGNVRMDEERVIIGISRAALEDAIQAEEEFERLQEEREAERREAEEEAAEEEGGGEEATPEGGEAPPAPEGVNPEEVVPDQ